MASISPLSVEINSPKIAVWDILADIGVSPPGRPPSITRSEPTRSGPGSAVNARVESAIFGKVTERVEAWDEGKSLTIGIDSIGPMKSARSTFDLSEHKGRTTVDMTIRFDTRFGRIGALIDAIIMRRKLSQQSAVALASLKQCAETCHPITTQNDLNPETLATVA